MLCSSRHVAGLPILLIAMLAFISAYVNGAETPEVTTAKIVAATPKSDWWSFKPATRPSLPAGDTLLTNPIDLFVRAKLAEVKLKASPEADAPALIRRITYNLTGLPPSPEDLDAFVAAFRRDRESAYTALVDRLLASPRHGERWARHWLDVVHFGETHGYDKDKLRPHAWPYRDYVIRSLNADKSWSRFVEEQLAGDALYPDDPDGIVALGFIAGGPWDYVGHAELPITKTDGLIARYNDRDDMVMTTFSTFQSLTVHCARCHDHKFDPISQHEYYSLQAVFAGVDRANRPYDSDPEVHKARRTLAAQKKTLDARLAQLKDVIGKVSSPELVALDGKMEELKAQLGPSAVEGAEKKSPGNGYHSNIEGKQDATKWVQIDLGQVVPLDEVRLVPARPTDFPDTPGFGFPVRFKVEAADDLNFASAKIIADRTAADFKNPGDVPFTIAPQAINARYVRVTTTRLWERTKDFIFALGELQVFSGDTNLARAGSVTALDSIESGRWSKKNLIDGYSSRSRLADASYPPAELARRRTLDAELSRLTQQRKELFASLVPVESKNDQARVEAELASISKSLAALPEPTMVYAAASDFKPEGSFVPAKGMRPVHFLPRGDVKRPQESMQPGALACVPGPEARFNLSTNHTESERRAALARWLTDSRNLQTRRSIVNRVWQTHFGRGLVDTPNDFGHMGSPPSHPELLDWLAFWFQENGESLKKLHRLIVTSATYRQSSIVRSTAGEKLDADNRYLWRMNRTRLDAESIRDAMLQVSGQLDLTMGGPSDRQFFFKDDHSPIYDYTRFDVDSKEGRRRSIYRHLVRSVTDPFMDCLDAADPSQLVARRNTTLTALQALATLNNPFVLRQCEHLAARLQAATPDLPGQITLAYRLAYGRGPGSGEMKSLSTYARNHGLASACRVLLNSTEFMFVD